VLPLHGAELFITKLKFLYIGSLVVRLIISKYTVCVLYIECVYELASCQHTRNGMMHHRITICKIAILVSMQFLMY